MRQLLGAAPVNPPDAVRLIDLGCKLVLQSALPFVVPPSGFMANNGAVVLGQAPPSSATVTFGAKTGSGVNCTFTQPTLSGNATDDGRVLTVLDTTYKYFTITAGSSTTVCTGTVSGANFSQNTFANNAVWISGYPAGGTPGYSTPLVRAVGGCYSYFPAGAISSSSAAGWYWTNWLSPTVGVVYNNTFAAGAPSAVASPTAFATSGPGAFTQTLARILGPNATLAGNAMGINGSLEFSILLSMARSTSGRYANAQIGAGNYLGQVGEATSPFNQCGGLISVTNQGIANLQFSTPMAGLASGDYVGGAAGGTPNITTIDTTQPQTVGVCLQLLQATDSIILERHSVKLYPTSP